MKNNLPVTKTDLDKAVAKLATKQDLKQFATKDELRNTEKSLRVSMHLDFQEFKEEIKEELKERFGLIPTKNEFFNTMDKLMKELLAMREEHAINGYHLKDHEDRITVLEQTAGLATV